MAVAKGGNRTGREYVCADGHMITFAAVRNVSWPANGELVRCSLCSAAHPPLQALTPLQGNPGFYHVWLVLVPAKSYFSPGYVQHRYSAFFSASFASAGSLTTAGFSVRRYGLVGSGHQSLLGDESHRRDIDVEIAAMLLLLLPRHCHGIIIGTESVIGYLCCVLLMWE